jgi:hypothetical protein
MSRLCKPEVTGSIPVRSTEKSAGNGGFLIGPNLQVGLNARLWKRLWKPEAAKSLGDVGDWPELDEPQR